MIQIKSTYLKSILQSRWSLLPSYCSSFFFLFHYRFLYNLLKLVVSPSPVTSTTLVPDAVVMVTLVVSLTTTLMMSPLSDSVDLTAKVDPQDLVGGICSVNCWQLELVAEVDGSLET